jgi:hypothetical protein
VSRRTVLDLICASAVDVLHCAGLRDPDKARKRPVHRGEDDGIDRGGSPRRRRPAVFTSACQIGIVLKLEEQKKRRPKSAAAAAHDSTVQVRQRCSSRARRISTFWSIRMGGEAVSISRSPMAHPSATLC